MDTNKATITRESLSKTLVKSLHINGVDSYKYVESVIAIITKALLNNHKVRIRLFGSLNVKYKKARIGRNPKTQVEAIIHSRKVVQFKIATTFKQKIRDNSLMIKEVNHINYAKKTAVS